jgi:CheY-like chemotaxis protein
MSATLSDRAFVRELRRVLYRLYDPRTLRNSSLVPLLRVDCNRTPSGLQRIITDAIAALEPGPSVSSLSDAARTHSILSSRFVDQFSQPEVAATLGLSVRQMQREEQIALRALADHLIARYGLRLVSPDTVTERSSADRAQQTEADSSGREDELRLLETSYPMQPTAAREVLQAVLDTAAPLTEALGVSVACLIDADLPAMAVQQISLRQALLSVISASIRAAPGGSVEIRATRTEHQVRISVLPNGSCAVAASLQGLGDSLSVVRELVRLSGGSFALPGENDVAGEAGFGFSLPAVAQTVVLAIDDNTDALQLLQRYLADTRYHLVGVCDPQQALAEAERLVPAIVLLDVMLPGLDGWELLGRLREHPRLHDVPIVVCTILPMEQFALTLGAAAFIRKPVTPEALLPLLDRLSALRSPRCSQNPQCSPEPEERLALRRV